MEKYDCPCSERTWHVKEVEIVKESVSAWV